MRKAPPFVFVKGAPPGFRKLKNRLTGKVNLIRMKGRKAGIKATKRGLAFNPGTYEMRRNPAPRRLDDIGSGKYDFLGMSKRAPLHYRKAKEFFKKGDFFNSRMHAIKALQFGAEGYLPVKMQKEMQELNEKLLRTGNNPIRVRKLRSGKVRRNPPLKRASNLYTVIHYGYGQPTAKKSVKAASPLSAVTKTFGGFGAHQVVRQGFRTKFLRENGLVWFEVINTGSSNPISVRKRKLRKLPPPSKYWVDKIVYRGQARLLHAREHGFKPAGRPARSVVKRAQAMRRGASNTTLFAIRTGRRRRITLRTKPVGGQVIARNLTLGQLKTRARQHHFKLRSL